MESKTANKEGLLYIIIVPEREEGENLTEDILNRKWPKKEIIIIKKRNTIVYRFFSFHSV